MKHHFCPLVNPRTFAIMRGVKLEQNNVQYLLIGGYAVGIHGYPRATGDMDIFIAFDEATAVFISVNALRTLTSMKTAVCCDSRWSPMSDASCSQDSTCRAVRASRQTLCKVPYVALVIHSLHEFGFASASADLLNKPSSMFRMGVPPNKLEITNFIDGITFDDCFQNQVRVKIDGIELNLIGLANLRKNKKAS